MSEAISFLITIVGVCQVAAWFMSFIEKIDDCKRNPR